MKDLPVADLKKLATLGEVTADELFCISKEEFAKLLMHKARNHASLKQAIQEVQAEAQAQAEGKAKAQAQDQEVDKLLKLSVADLKQLGKSAGFNAHEMSGISKRELVELVMRKASKQAIQNAQERAEAQAEAQAEFNRSEGRAQARARARAQVQENAEAEVQAQAVDKLLKLSVVDLKQLGNSEGFNANEMSGISKRELVELVMRKASKEAIQNAQERAKAQSEFNRSKGQDRRL